jgi:hypothetical protein
MPDDRYRNLPFAPWASSVSAQRDIQERLQLLEQALEACQERPPGAEEREAIDWLAARDSKLAGHCRRFTAALACPYPEQRQVDALAALARIKSWLGNGRD